VTPAALGTQQQLQQLLQWTLSTLLYALTISSNRIINQLCCIMQQQQQQQLRKAPMSL
jgi:hypothetical protein